MSLVEHLETWSPKHSSTTCIIMDSKETGGGTASRIGNPLDAWDGLAYISKHYKSNMETHLNAYGLNNVQITSSNMFRSVEIVRYAKFTFMML